MRSKGRSRPMSATLTTKRKSARDRPASSKERVGELGERKREIDRGARGQRPARNWVQLTLPEGQCRTLMPRGPSPVVPASRRCVRDTAPCMSPPSGVAHVRSPSLSLLLPPAAPRRRRHASLCCSLSCAKHLTCCTYGCRHLCRARTRMREIWCVGGVWRALGEHVLDRFAAASPAALVWPQE